MGGWRWEDVQALPVEVYQELVAWLQDQADRSGLDEDEPVIDMDTWLARRR